MKEASRQRRLRSATAQAHARVGNLVESANFFRDREGYAAYLAATWQARCSMELCLDRCGAEHIYPIWSHRKIGPTLRADLRDVSGCDVACYSTTTTSCTSMQILGILYVLEGSALGARILAPRALALGMSAQFGARHLALQISSPGAWKVFITALDAARVDPDQEDVCIAAALDTFTHFEAAYAMAIATRENGKADLI